MLFLLNSRSPPDSILKIAYLLPKLTSCLVHKEYILKTEDRSLFNNFIRSSAC